MITQIIFPVCYEIGQSVKLDCQQGTWKKTLVEEIAAGNEEHGMPLDEFLHQK